MNLENGTLVEWLQKKQSENPEEFPPGDRSIDYFRRYKGIEEYLANNIYPHVNAGAMLTDKGYLTDHGVGHINKVIKKTSEIVSADKCSLTPYEVYILLTAILLHDVGNIFGRKKHTINAADVLKDMEMLTGDDSVEKRWIREIAKAHGAEDGDKDTISKLPYEEVILGQKIRMQLLSSILKFSDELADDKERAARYLLKKGKIPVESLIYHKFASCLDSVVIDHKAKGIDLLFHVPEGDVITKFHKGKAKSYLLDEVFDRTMKTHLERVYCSRFMRPEIQLDYVNVKMTVYTNEHFEEIREIIGYRLQERGYPSCSREGIYELCPDLKKWKKQKLTGTNLAKHIKKKRR